MEANEAIGSEHPKILTGWRFKLLLATVILSGLGYLAFSLWGGWNDVVDASNRVGVLGILFACSISFSAYVFRFIRWNYYITVLGHSVPLKDHFRIYLSGFALTTTPGRSGEAIRGAFLKPYGVPYKKSVGAFVAERFSDLMAMMLLTIGGLLSYKSSHNTMIGITLFLLTFFTLIQSQTLLKGFENFTLKWLPSKFSKGIVFTIETILSFRECFKFKTLMISTFLGVLSWGAECTAFYTILKLLEADISYLTAVFIMAFSQIIGGITFLPGGLGGTEVTMFELLRRNEVVGSSAIAATIICRLTTLWFAVLLGLIAFPKTRKN